MNCKICCRFFLKRPTLLIYLQAISFTNLPASTSQHENYDGAYQILQIKTSDNNGDYDNVTCEMTSFAPAESNMFELRHNGQYKYNCKTWIFNINFRFGNAYDMSINVFYKDISV